MLTDELKAAYRWHKQNPRMFNAGYLAIDALRLARADVAAGKHRYPHDARYSAPGAQFPGYGTKQMRWCESPADIGLRFVGYADKLARIDHTGWWTDDDGCGESVRGVVYQLPARNGRNLYVAGYDNAMNGAADNGGPAAIDFGTLWEGEPLGFSPERYRDYFGAHADAAYHADKLAERMAEQEREYQRAYAAGNAWADLGEQIAEVRKALLAMLAERRQAKADGVAYPAICAALANKVAAMLDDIGAWRSKRADLASGDDDRLGFWTGDESLRSAFNEGAGETVLA